MTDGASDATTTATTTATPAGSPAGSPAPSVESAASGLGMTSSLRLARGEIPSTWTKPAEAVSQLPAPAPRPGISGVLIGAGVLACVALAVVIAPRPEHPPAAKGAAAAPSTSAAASPSTSAAVPSNASSTPPAPTPSSASSTPLSSTTAPTPSMPAPAAAPSTAPSTTAPASTTSPDDPPAAPKPIAEAAPAFSPKRKGISPEDENPGDDVKPHVAAAPPLGALTLPKGPPPAPPGAPGPATTSTATAATAPPGAATTSDGLGELPAHKKAKGLTQKAIALLRDGDYANAEPNLVRAVLIDPTYADAWRHLGIARAQLGDKDGARRAYRKYITLAPNAPDAGDVKKILAAP